MGPWSACKYVILTIYLYRKLYFYTSVYHNFYNLIMLSKYRSISMPLLFKNLLPENSDAQKWVYLKYIYFKLYMCITFLATCLVFRWKIHNIMHPKQLECIPQWAAWNWYPFRTVSDLSMHAIILYDGNSYHICIKTLRLEKMIPAILYRIELNR